ncbi:hypothetical protein KCP71_23005 [Salmonella enterica subsp. enterica]|nr:hypothetical protein KCP71_23005 [Salmonella enterica subsp. enterica]
MPDRQGEIPPDNPFASGGRASGKSGSLRYFVTSQGLGLLSIPSERRAMAG